MVAGTNHNLSAFLCPYFVIISPRQPLKRSSKEIAFSLACLKSSLVLRNGLLPLRSFLPSNEFYTTYRVDSETENPMVAETKEYKLYHQTITRLFSQLKKCSLILTIIHYSQKQFSSSLRNVCNLTSPSLPFVALTSLYTNHCPTSINFPLCLGAPPSPGKFRMKSIYCGVNIEALPTAPTVTIVRLKTLHPAEVMVHESVTHP